MLAWEWVDRRNLAVHHLMVVCYHLQHPSLYSPEGLARAEQLPGEFVEGGAPPDGIRRRDRAEVDSRNRKRRIAGTPASHGSLDAPIRWTTTAGDVVAGGIERYGENVRAWARSVVEDITVLGHCSPS